MLILHCEDSLEGIFTAIYDAFVYKKQMKQPYRDDIEIAMGEGCLTLFAEEQEVVVDAEKVEKTVRTIQSRLGFRDYQTIVSALCHFAEDRASIVLGYLVQAFAVGHSVMDQLADPFAMRMMELDRKVANEADKMRGFLRFQEVHSGAESVLLAEIEPKCNLVPLMMDHFSDRFPNENFIMYDCNRKIAAVHEAYHACVLVSGDNLHIPEKEGDYFTELWKQYFMTMEIKPRHNEKCQNNLMPKWYRKHMPEIIA